MLELIEVGKLGKSHGVKGAIRVIFDEDSDLYIDDVTTIFIQVKGDRVPYFVESVDDVDGLMVKFESVNSPESARNLAGSKIYLSSDDLPNGDMSPPNIGDFSGYTLYDDADEIGVITEVREYPQQMMAIIVREQEELLIPIVEELILDIDIENKKLYMKLPEGLLDI